MFSNVGFLLFCTRHYETAGIASDELRRVSL